MTGSHIVVLQVALSVWRSGAVFYVRTLLVRAEGGRGLLRVSGSTGFSVIDECTSELKVLRSDIGRAVEKVEEKLVVQDERRSVPLDSTAEYQVALSILGLCSQAKSRPGRSGFRDSQTACFMPMRPAPV